MVVGGEARSARQGGRARAGVGVAVASWPVDGQSYVVAAAVELPLPGRGWLSIQSGSQGGGGKGPPGSEWAADTADSLRLLLLLL